MKNLPKGWTHIYTGKCRGCDSIVSACVDDPATKSSTAKSVGNMVMDGLEVERVPIGDGVRVSPCKCNKATGEQPLPLFAAQETA